MPRVRLTTRENLNARYEQRYKATKRDALHTAEITVRLPDFVAVSPHGAIQGAKYNKGEKQRDEPFAVPEKASNERKEWLEPFFNAERPEYVPAPRKITAMSFEHIHVG
jgi:hypothetical protein